MTHLRRMYVTMMVLTIGLVFLGSAFVEPSETTEPVPELEMDGLSLQIQTQLNMLTQEIIDNNYSYTVGYNPAMDYPIEQLCGLVEPEGWTEEAAAQSQFSTIQLQESLPSSFDWRDQNGVTPVRNQGGCGSCWAFGTVGVLESAVKIQVGLDVDLSEQYLVSCNESGWSCGGGWWAHDYHWWRIPSVEDEAGAVLEADFPYEADDVDCDSSHPHEYVIDNWVYVNGEWPSVDAIKQAIYQYGPVAAAVAVGEAFQGYTGGVFDNDEYPETPINHAIILVGWNDDYYGDGSNVGVWILRNSWSTWWGENGYMYITYDTSAVGYAANYVEFTAPATSERDHLMVLRQRPDGKYKLQIYDLPSSVGGNTGSSVASDNNIGSDVMGISGGECDGDADDELVFMRHSPTGHKSLFICDMPIEVQGNTGPPIASDSKIGSTNKYTTVGDFDGDGEPEVAVIRYNAIADMYRLLIFEMPEAVAGDTPPPFQ